MSEVVKIYGLDFALINKASSVDVRYISRFIATPGGGSWSPLDISGLKLWLKADAGITKDEDDLVTVWADQSGRGLDATIGISPLWVDAVVNGKPVVRFDGTSFMNHGNNSESLSLPHTYFIVYKYNDPLDGVSQGLFDQNGTFRIVGKGDPWTGIGDNRMIRDWGANLIEYGVATSNFELVAAVFKETDAAVYLNGSFQATGSIAAGETNGGYFVGAMSYLSSTRTKADIAEVLWYNAELSISDRQAAENYLMVKYGL